MIHRHIHACCHNDPPRSEEYAGDGRVCEWRSTCECGWEGPWRGTSEAASLARLDYHAHVEDSLGVGAYYDADVACRNCGSKHRQGVHVGTHVTSAACSQCGTVMLNPDNEAWDDSRAITRGFWR